MTPEQTVEAIRSAALMISAAIGQKSLGLDTNAAKDEGAGAYIAKQFALTYNAIAEAIDAPIAASSSS